MEASQLAAGRPELHWQHGYPFALGLMGSLSLALYLLFKRRHWI